jgi:hypothetical protein
MTHFLLLSLYLCMPYTPRILIYNNGANYYVERGLIK